MRTQLQQLAGRRVMYRGTFIRFSSRVTPEGNIIGTVLITHVMDELSQFVADHVWISDDTSFRGMNLKLGDRVQFMAKVEFYEKHNGSKDYGLRCPVFVRKISHDR